MQIGTGDALLAAIKGAARRSQGVERTRFTVTNGAAPQGAG
nr:hypothetical protein [Xylella fastidiosa]